ncbi:Powdery mildew resistance protein [Hirschfeldia incana]|nr:Powdery mildew resistance protein [Hirschfeldia incana]
MDVVPFAEIMKLVISQANKVKDFKPLFKELASTIERLVPIFEEIDLLHDKMDPGNKELIVLTKLMLSAKKMVHKCSRVRVYNLVKINSYTKQINKINDDFVKFCQVDLQLIGLRDRLRSRSQTSLKIQESPPPAFQGERRKQVQVGGGQLPLGLQESLKMEDLLSSPEVKELNSAIQESLFLRRQQEGNGKRKQVQEDELVAAALQESLNSFKEKGKRKQVQEDELVAVAIQESLHSFKDKKRRKQVQEDELVAVAIQESLSNFKDNGKRKQAQEDEIFARDLQERINNGSSSFTRAHSFDEDDMQRVLFESLTKKPRRSL